MKKLLILCAVLLTSGCAQMTSYHPTVDTFGDKRAAYINADFAECQALASQAGSVGKEAATGAVAGSGMGAVAGAVAGAFLGNPAFGAGIGGAAGGLAGGAYGSVNADVTYKRAFRTCMKHRGHAVLD